VRPIGPHGAENELEVPEDTYILEVVEGAWLDLFRLISRLGSGWEVVEGAWLDLFRLISRLGSVWRLSHDHLLTKYCNRRLSPIFEASGPIAGTTLNRGLSVANKL
jgi:predicted neuraminidase